jgi:phosphohistidine phosphatase
MSGAAGLRELVLVRHAKSSWNDPDLIDLDRPLAARGRNDAPLMAAELAYRKIKPGFVLCSPAARTRQTLSYFRGLWTGRKVILKYPNTLYMADVGEWMQLLRTIPAGIRCAMAFGHNPGLHGLLACLSGKKIRKFPTCASACLTFTGSWSDLNRGCADLAWKLRPKDL